MAIDRYVRVAFQPRDDRRIRVRAVAFDEIEEVDLDDLPPPGDGGWVSYVAGVAWAMEEAGHEIRGIDAVIDGDLPVGSGLSSSAALEMATARALCEASGIPWNPREMARLGQRAENRYVGLACGVMDQLAAACAEDGCALLLDCRTLATQAVVLPGSAKVVVMDTGARRRLAGSAYNQRRASCEAAAAALGVEALRDADLELLAAGRARIGELDYRRAKHVIEENSRPRALAAALRNGSLGEAGRLMNDSHASLRDLFEVSCPELDRITELARGHPACFGARLTGAGFGGCAVALVAAGDVEAFARDVHRAYRRDFDLPSRVFACEAVAGARLLEAEE